MKTVLVIIMTLGTSMAWGSGCDSRVIVEPINSLYSVQVESDLGHLTRSSVVELMQAFKNNYGHNVASELPDLADRNFRVRTQWVTYKHLDTDCGWNLYKWTVTMRQLVIQVSANKILIYPSLSDLRGENIAATPYLKLRRNDSQTAY